MNYSNFNYGSFRSGNVVLSNSVPKEDENFKEKTEEWIGEFKPVQFSEKQKETFRKYAIRAEKNAIKNERKLIKQKALDEKKQEKLLRREEAKKTRVARPIGVKLIGIISVIVILALGGVTYLVSYFVSADTRTSAEENNLTINSRTASDCENRINTVISSVSMFLDLLKNAGENETDIKSAQKLFFDRNKEIVAVFLPNSNRLFFNAPFSVANEISEETLLSYMNQEEELLFSATDGNTGIENASPFFNLPLLLITSPVRNGTKENAVAVLYSSEGMSESFASGNINQSFFVNNEGQILIHSDLSLMMNADYADDDPIVKSMQQSSVNNSQITYTGLDGEEYIGAFRKLGVGNGAVITVVKTAIVLEAVNATTRRNIFITVAILSIAIMVIYFFSKSLSVPLKQLTAVVNEINKGNFNTELFNELKIKGKDEISVLIKSTRKEREILNTFTKLTNKGVTKAIISNDIDFDPHLKDITIFFSDIRGFTAISDGFKNRFGERSAGEIINFLNDYMSRMVTCIRRTGGIVDKFEGDAIMACWGVLRRETLDWEQMNDTSVTKVLAKEKHDQYVKEDALSAITSCIAMRYSLMKYNKDAKAFTEEHKNDSLAQYKPFIRIGAGLNTGRATVGFMGSYDKMEFTSIGDAVNFASRTEASNKPCGTDILISEDTYQILKKDYIRCPENRFFIQPENLKNEIIVEQIPVEFEVKGKGKQHFYGVVNMPQFDIYEFFSEADPMFELDEDCEVSAGPKGPKTLSQVRKLLDIPVPDFEKVNLDAEENKVKVAAP